MSKDSKDKKHKKKQQYGAASSRWVRCEQRRLDRRGELQPRAVRRWATIAVSLRSYMSRTLLCLLASTLRLSVVR